MFLRCRSCRDATDVGDGDVESWRFPLWDHLMDQHMDLVALGRHSSVEFTGAGGLTCRVTETGVTR